MADSIALLDMCHTFTDVVVSSRDTWCRPKVSENDGALAIRNGRYAINVTTHDSSSGQAGGGGRKGAAQQEQAESQFVPNDTYCAPFQNFIIVTGINGSGKSTYLKQIALIVILGQCGCFVPADECYLPLRDRLATRIGTSDDQENNISSFMLEMKDVAFITSQCTDKSLILIDELGRATSNEDGKYS
jgi:DNA mismatch repair protein MSH4